MPNWIQHICEPNRLILAWQAPDAVGERRRFAVGAIVRSGADCVLKYFANKEVDEAKALGYAGYPAFKLDEREYKGALATFLRRLPPRGRPDFAAYAEHFRLQADVKLSDFALLAYTEAKLPSDGFSIVNPLDDVQQPCEFVLEVAGYRHYAKNVEIKIGEVVEFVAEPTNKWDANAIAIKAHNEIIGYVNRLQTSAFHRWLRENSLVAAIERINGREDRPRSYIFVWVRSHESKANLSQNTHTAA